MTKHVHKLLVVDDEESVRAAVKRRLSRDGYEVSEADSEDAAEVVIRDANPAFDVVVTDMVMNGDQAGVSVLKSALARDIFTEVIVLTAYGNVANAVECMKLGAFDYVEKNIPGVDVYDLLSIKVGQALDRRKSSVGTVRRADMILKGISSE
jgi:DNA-binding NtrC family response regulator